MSWKNNTVLTPKNKDLLDSPERKKTIPHRKVIGATPDTEKNHTILDVGAGTGYFFHSQLLD